MIPGFNHNVRYLGHVYHVQTEDSGIDNPHIITLLYLSGTIIAKKKTSYAEILRVEQLPEVVRELMQEQHKCMLRELLRGGIDAVRAECDRESTVQDLLKARQSAAGAPAPRPSAASSAPEAKGYSIPLPKASPAPSPKYVAPVTQAKVPEVSESDIASLFGGGSHSEGEKSLDEIILGYLSGEGK